MAESSRRGNHKTTNGGLIINKGLSSKTTILAARKVAVLYYLSRNGQLEHPHLIDVSLSSPHALYLRDVINTLNHHRGKGMANMYSWSFKRSYKNGYVWYDASENDVIQPTNGHDYVIKGSELLQTHQPENYHSGENCSSTTPVPAEATVVRRNLSWSSFDNPPEYSIAKCESNRELVVKSAFTQTSEEEDVIVEMTNDEMPSPPPSNSSSEVLEAVSGSRYVDRTVEDHHGNSGRMKASQVLKQLITCGNDKDKNVNSEK